MASGPEINCFSYVIQPKEIVCKSVNNGPTFTKFHSCVAKYVCYEWVEMLPHRISGLNM